MLTEVLKQYLNLTKQIIPDLEKRFIIRMFCKLYVNTPAEYICVHFKGGDTLRCATSDAVTLLFLRCQFEI